MQQLSLMDGRISAAARVSSPRRWVICSHGLQSSKDSHKYLLLADMAAQRSISLLRFDHRGCGDSRGSFEKSTLSRRIADLQAAIQWVRQRYGQPEIALFGSSFGGMVSIMAADRDIKALVLVATPYEIPEDLGIGEAFMADLQRYDVLQAIQQVPPVLILHGRDDRVVPVEHAHSLHEHAPAEKKLLLYDADHRFSDAAVRRAALTAALDWIDSRL